MADCDLSLIDDARLVWNAFSDDARDDLFGPGPVGDPVSALAPPVPHAAVASAADERRPAGPAPLALPSAEGGRESGGRPWRLTASRPGRSARRRSRTAASGSTAVASTAKACELIVEAGRGGADIVALPESFIPGFPYWLFTRR